MTLKQWLEDNGWTVPALAEYLGVTQQSVYGWIAGTFQPSATNLTKIEILTDGAVTSRWFSNQRGVLHG